ncbi:MAG: HD domain-containing protein [Deltaproteobacteria bacterium]|nr:HD domain-containing protein [Deltaproteobacteria bacterium]
MSTLELPDTLPVKKARALLEQAAPALIVAHTLRTFHLARAVGHKRALDFDEEGLALAALFHDLGLCEGHRVSGKPFPIASSRLLRAELTGQIPDERIGAMADAVEQHMQFFPRWSMGPVAGLLQIGAWMDVTGRGRGQISEEATRIRAELPPPQAGWPFWKGVLPKALNPLTCVGYVFPQLFK